jgi:Fur family transcriptional regulator, ferric uptake regulator
VGERGGAYTAGMESADHLFRDFLRDHGLKYTTERLAILKGVQRFGRPFEAEELLLALRDSEYRISKATVYRTIKHLQDAGLMRQVFFGGNKQSHYEFVDPRSSHDHLLDLDTGKIIPFDNELVIKLREHIAKKMGFVAVNHRFQIIGKRKAE